MRTHDFLNRLIAGALVLDLFVSLVTYLLYQLDGRFFWLFFASMVVLFWLFFAGFCSLVDSLVNGNE